MSLARSWKESVRETEGTQLFEQKGKEEREGSGRIRKEKRMKEKKER